MMSKILTEQETKEWEEKIDKMSHIEMARLWRFSPSGNPVFSSQNRLFVRFKKRFDSLGGMTVTISKALGWHDCEG